MKLDENSRRIHEKPIYLCWSILEICKVVKHKFLCSYVKYGEKSKLCYMYACSFIVYIKKDIYVGIAKDVKKELILQILN